MGRVLVLVKLTSVLLISELEKVWNCSWTSNICLARIILYYIILYYFETEVERWLRINEKKQKNGDVMELAGRCRWLGMVKAGSCKFYSLFW
jgi:hypothetical protein